MTSYHRLPPPLLDVYEWQSRGLCRTTDGALFFESDAERGRAREQHQAAAKAVCQRCPVMMECRAHAIEVEDYGVWGGLTAEERIGMRVKKSA
jgi:WhiB family redox-sensing transcriptional regulator